ncbi:sensor domain-containing diguanylate cyclase [Halomonas denitrificans]|uniref:sensor domain-containing diguanylate cyclase n=1 Tax=Halomonas denitrificans TaxID=370769 RepID=UPI001C99CDB2|nr:sensor domain-containing diguanylate cyclase [Halomonas denitrificans]MBY5967427.1 sensor domain-containing diguanylate cyclase [Halomonas denitrificans]
MTMQQDGMNAWRGGGRVSKASEPGEMTSLDVDLTIELPVRFVHELSAAESLQDVLDTVARWSHTVFGANRASITLAKSETELALIAMQGNNAIPVDAPMPIEGTMVGRVYRTRQAEYAASFEGSSDLDCQMLRSKGLRCCLDVPMISSGRCMGTMNIAHETSDAFSDLDRQRLQAMAHWVAASIRIHHQMEEMALLSGTDPLTGVCNRRAFATRFGALTKRWQCHSAALGIALIDLDHFKSINDTYGHDVGDQVLVAVAKALTSSFRKSDLIARMGGEEFCVVMADVDKPALMVALERFNQALASLDVSAAGAPIAVTASIGALLIDQGHEDLSQLVSHADKAMYRAKTGGRNRIEFVHLKESAT